MAELNTDTSNKGLETLLLLEEVASDVLEELLGNLDKDITKNRDFWAKMKKKCLSSP